MTILRAIHGETIGYRHHPAAIMWEKHPEALCSYGLYVCDEWMRRGYIDNQRDKIRSFFPFSRPTPAAELRDIGMLPWWFGWAPFHRAHRSNLFRKKPDHYGPALECDDETMPYVWPTPERGVYKKQHSKTSPYYVSS